ncbi:uncharacterized protein N7515_004000 [Penicillium bovifimosum]|uniref:Uncharacterized protein n=1 Tax=Penicillium bovifimosum TaxID=126998 RepID=A0A9W9L6R9_9EURO|nr:uncharacterized protein N7515_004000 [Penicillium bovifimosum]KAJ5139152.1 hypothetical protein N7515_004000 [Penicillium bovifimosum]
MSPARITLWARDTASDLKSVPSTFSSWDKCMAKSYCKWPVIVGIIVGCCCPSGRRRNKPSKHLDDSPFHQPPPPVQNPVYQPSPAPPSYRGAPQSAPSFRGGSQTARFDAPKTPVAHVNEDALPDMPTWAGAVDKHVEVTDHHDDVEMKPLDPPDRKQGAGTPGVAYSDYSPNPAMAAGGYRGFNPTDPYARRSPGPGAALNPAQDPYARRSPGVPSAGGAIDPYGRRSPGPAAALGAAEDPYGRRSPGPAAALAASQDPYGRRSPGVAVPSAAVDPYGRRSPGPPVGYGASPQDPYGSRTPLASPVGAPVHNPYDQQHYENSHDEESYGAGGNGYHALTAPSPVAAYKPHTNYSPVPMPSPSSEVDHPTPGFQRQPSFGSSQYPPSYTSQPSYRGFSSGAAPSSEYTTYNPHANSTLAPEPDNTRPPSLLQSGKKPPLNASSNF